MQLNPTASARSLAVSALGMVVAGVWLGLPSVVAWGGGIALGLAVARAATLIGVAKIRSAGFEMLWQEEQRSLRASVGQSLELAAEVRNRDQRAARYTGLRVIANPNLKVSVTPESGEVPAGGRLAVTVSVEPLRVGRHGIHGLALEVRGGPGLFQVPLAFANPFCLEVLPRVYHRTVISPRGGRSRRSNEVGRPRRRRGESGVFAEIRDHHVGDPFKKIAWKASARRGKLLVRNYDIEESSLVWVVLDAALDSWAGLPGTAPLDLAIEQAAAIIDRHLRNGDRVGLAITAARWLSFQSPASGAAALGRALEALGLDTHTYDSDRSALDETEVAARVLEHMRPLEPTFAQSISPNELDRIARRASALIQRAPLTSEAPRAPTERERVLRHYLLTFGIASPPRLDPDRTRSDRTMGEALERIARETTGGALIYVCCPIPDVTRDSPLGRALTALPRRRFRVAWIPTPYERSLAVFDGNPEADAEPSETARSSADRTTTLAVRDAVSLRLQVAEREGARSLTQLGVLAPRPRTFTRLGPHVEK